MRASHDLSSSILYYAALTSIQNPKQAGQILILAAALNLSRLSDIATWAVGIASTLTTIAAVATFALVSQSIKMKHLSLTLAQSEFELTRATFELAAKLAVDDRTKSDDALEDPTLSIANLDRFDVERIRIEDDPNLVLIFLRYEIERRLSAIALARGVDVPRPSAIGVLTALSNAGILDRRQTTGYRELIEIGNRAVHAAPVDLDAAQAARDVAPKLLSQLDRLYRESMLKSKIIEAATRKGLPIVEEALIGGFRADLIVADLIIEIKVASIRTIHRRFAEAVQQLEQVLPKSPSQGLIVASVSGITREMLEQDFLGFPFAVQSGNDFVGNEAAHRVAPWLFEPSSAVTTS